MLFKIKKSNCLIIDNLSENSSNNNKLPILQNVNKFKTFPFEPLINSENINQINITNYNLIVLNQGLLNRYNSSFNTLSTVFFSQNFSNKNNFFISEESSFVVNENEFFSDDKFFKKYTHLRKSTFIDFFLTNLVDIPICFKKIKSLRRRNFEFFFLKFTNLLMRKGKREQIFSFLLKAFSDFFYSQFEISKFPNWRISWFEIFFFFNFNIKLKYLNLWSEKSSFNDELLNFNFTLNENFKEMDSRVFFKNFFYSKLTQFSPLFSYFVYNVDKNIRKYTRGKSGKYVFVWKYVAPYKRSYLTYRWFLKELKFDDNRYFHKRLYNLFQTLTYNIKQTFAWKSKNYTYAFIFKNFRKSLMSNLKTIAQ